jgi:hypothetical protein
LDLSEQTQQQQQQQIDLSGIVTRRNPVQISTVLKPQQIPRYHNAYACTIILNRSRFVFPTVSIYLGYDINALEPLSNKWE